MIVDQIRISPPCSKVSGHVHGEACIPILLRLLSEVPESNYEVGQDQHGNWTVFIRFIDDDSRLEIADISPTPEKQQLWVQIAKVCVESSYPYRRVVDWDGTRFLLGDHLADVSDSELND